MSRELDPSFFDNVEAEPAVPEVDYFFAESVPVAGAGISQETAEYLANRTHMFQQMTQRKNAPMVYGTQKKEKR